MSRSGDDAIGSGDDAIGRGAASDPADSDSQRIRLVKGGAILLEDAGFRVVAARGWRRSPIHPYASLTHLCLANRALLIGTTGGLIVVRTQDFADPERGPAAARDGLIARLAERPEGRAVLRAMARVEDLSTRKHPLYALWATIALCLVGTAFQLADPLIDQVGAFVPELFARGESWRAITAHFLHALPAEPGIIAAWIPGLRGLPIHLAINVGGLFVLGPLVERPLGSWRTTLLLILAGVGTVVGILLAGHHEVMGASGLVAGLAGAILALELHFPESLPSDWRLPRRFFVMAVVLQFGVIDPLLRSFIAGGAHLGGFVGGYAAAWWLGAADLDSPGFVSRLRFAALCGLASLAAGAIGIVPLARHDQPALERHAARLLDAPSAPHLLFHENAAAWFISTEPDPTATGLELAVALADRAVVTTERLHPGILDTLAEALFQSGDRVGAILTIDEAITLAPAERYFIEQRRRFTGERAADDRPPQPGEEGLEGSPFGGDVAIDPDAPQITL